MGRRMVTGMRLKNRKREAEEGEENCSPPPKKKAEKKSWRGESEEGGAVEKVGRGPERGDSWQTPGRGPGAYPGGCGARLSRGLCLWAEGSSRLRSGRSSLQLASGSSQARRPPPNHLQPRGPRTGGDQRPSCKAAGLGSSRSAPERCSIMHPSQILTSLSGSTRW